MAKACVKHVSVMEDGSDADHPSVGIDYIVLDNNGVSHDGLESVNLDMSAAGDRAQVIANTVAGACLRDFGVSVNAVQVWHLIVVPGA